MSARLLFLLTALALTGCVRTTQTAKPAATPSAQIAPTPKPPKPFFLFAWMKKVSRLLPHKTKPPAATTPQWAGAIRMVNTAENFVLIESGTIANVIPGETYVAVSNGSETASLRMTNLKNPPFLIADILSGNPSPGEKIYLPKAPAQLPPTPTPKPAPKKPKPKPTPAKTEPQTLH